MKFSKKVIVFMLFSVILFVCVMIVTYWQKGGVPDTLIDRFFAFFSVEGGALAIIKVGETLAEKFDKKEKTPAKRAKKERKDT